MIEYELHIETHGICTHFTHGVVSGVPHRVVLGDTTHIQAGTVALANQPQLVPARYYLIPHFPQIEIAGGPELNIPGLLRHGDVVTGVRLQVLNCVELGVSYEDDPGGPRLTTFYPEYTPSDDVVLNGRASCYFDVYGGSVSYVRPLTKGPGHMKIRMHTYDAPVLLVTPLAQAGIPGVPPAYRVTIPAQDPKEPIKLKVRNLELARELPAEAQLGAFDFLLHYLTARGGIPATIASATPGMPATPHSVTIERMAGALTQLADALVLAEDAAVRRPLLHEELVTESCAPSQYP